jgi:sugar phosphate permease
MLAGAPFAARVGRRAGMRWPLAGGLATLAVANCALVVRHESTAEFLVVMALVGAAFGIIYASLMTIAVEGAAATQVGVVTGLVTTMRSIGGQLGAQAAAAILATVVIPGTLVPREAAFELAFGLMGAVALLGSVGAVLLVPARSRSTREVATVEPAAGAIRP